MMILIVSILLYSKSNAQVDPQISNYYLTRGHKNPAFLLQNKNQVLISFLNRIQWTDLNNSPSTQILSFENHLKRALGFGIYVTNDKLGFESINSLEFHVSKEVTFKDIFLSGGFGFGLTNRMLEGSQLRYQNPDPNAIVTDQNQISTNLSLGVVFRINKLTLTGSIKNLTLFIDDNNFFNVPWNFYGETFYNFEISPKFSIEPSLLVKSVGWNTSLKFATLGKYLNRYLLGLSFEKGENLTTYIGFYVTPFLNMNFSFEKIFGNNIRINNNSFEASVSYLFNKKGIELKSPRYL